MAQNEMAQKAREIADELMNPKYANSDMHTVLEIAASRGMLFVMERERDRITAIAPSEPNDFRTYTPQSAGC